MISIYRPAKDKNNGGEDAGTDAPFALSLFPNPARSTATVRLSVPAPAEARVVVLDAQTWSDARQRWRQQLDDLMEEHLRGLAAVDPAEGACEYCHLRSFCRYRPS